MQFAIPAITNSSYEIQLANKYPDIRLFTVGDGTTSRVPLNNLATIQQLWSVASNTTIAGDGGFGYFSAVCWIFGRQVHDGLGGQVPVGLIASDWGGTPVEHWADAPAFARCNRTDTDSTLYNAMIYPFVVGPMAVTGFTWYQGEANTGSQASADAYACLFPSMIQSWRTNFGLAADAYFGFIQLSTWCAGDAIPIMRDAQLKALGPGVGYATNADHGAGCNIHPPPKQYCAARLANSALALAYKQPVTWKSPSYASAVAGAGSATITLNDVTPAGLTLKPSANAGTLNCTANAGQCAWASLQFNDAAKRCVCGLAGRRAGGAGRTARCPARWKSPLHSPRCYPLPFPRSAMQLGQRHCLAHRGQQGHRAGGAAARRRDCRGGHELRLGRRALHDRLPRRPRAGPAGAGLEPDPVSGAALRLGRGHSGLQQSVLKATLPVSRALRILEKTAAQHPGGSCPLPKLSQPGVFDACPTDFSPTRFRLAWTPRPR